MFARARAPVFGLYFCFFVSVTLALPSVGLDPSSLRHFAVMQGLIYYTP